MLPVREGEEVLRAVRVLVDAHAHGLGRTQPARVAHARGAVGIAVDGDDAARGARAEGPRAAAAELVGPVRPRLRLEGRDVVAKVGKSIARERVAGARARKHIAVDRVALRIERGRKARPRGAGDGDGRIHRVVGARERIGGVDRLREERCGDLLRHIHADRLGAAIAARGRLLRRRDLPHGARAADEGRRDDHEEHEDRRHEHDGVATACTGVRKAGRHGLLHVRHS